MRQFINSAPFYLQQKTSLLDAMKLMASHPSGYFLINDARSFLIGIVTRRDLLKKLAGIDLKKAADETIDTAMSSPVEFVRYKALEEDVIQIYQRSSIKQYPVLRNGISLAQKNIVGVIQLSDIAINRFTESCLSN